MTTRSDVHSVSIDHWRRYILIKTQGTGHAYSAVDGFKRPSLDRLSRCSLCLRQSNRVRLFERRLARRDASTGCILGRSARRIAGAGHILTGCERRRRFSRRQRRSRDDRDHICDGRLFEYRENDLHLSKDMRTRSDGQPLGVRDGVRATLPRELSRELPNGRRGPRGRRRRIRELSRHAHVRRSLRPPMVDGVRRPTARGLKTPRRVLPKRFRM